MESQALAGQPGDRLRVVIEAGLGEDWIVGAALQGHDEVLAAHAKGSGCFDELQNS
jgi:hypothetical protein